MASRPEQLYADDFYAWTVDQAGALRRLAEQRWNGPLDLAHLAEQVEELGMQARNAARSQLGRVIEHLLKLEHSPAREPRAGWMNSVDDAAPASRTLSPLRSGATSRACCRRSSAGRVAARRATRGRTACRAPAPTRSTICSPTTGGRPVAMAYRTV